MDDQGRQVLHKHPLYILHNGSLSFCMTEQFNTKLYKIDMKVHEVPHCIKPYEYYITIQSAT